MVMSSLSAQQAALAARRGDMKALGDVISAIAYGQAYLTRAGTPVSNITPDSIGQSCLDTTNGTWYKAKGLANTDWVVQGDPDLDLAELTVLDGATAGQSVVSKAVIIDSSGDNDRVSGGLIDGRFAHRTHFEVFDDFTDESLALTGVGAGYWASGAGTDGAADIGVITAGVPEGVMALGSAGAGGVEDGVTFNIRVLGQGSLISLGRTVVEFRVSFSQIAGTAWCFGLSDKVGAADERSLYTVNSGTVADAGLSVSNAICLAYDTDATAGSKWQFCHENGGTIGNSGNEDAHSTGPVADAYDIIRIEVDATGDARWYLNGTLIKSETTAVAPAALLVPFIGGDSADDADIATIVSVDYVLFSGGRATGQ